MEQEVLKDWQKKVMALVASTPELDHFYLTGGTALSGYYLQHRVSDDLDFFTQDDFDLLFIEKFISKIKEQLNASSVRFSRLYDRNQYFFMIGAEENKIEFTKYPFKQINPPEKRDGVFVDSEYDIAVNKLITLVERFDPKDFVDLYFLLAKYPLLELKNDVQKKFGYTLDPIFLGAELSKVKRVEDVGDAWLDAGIVMFSTINYLNDKINVVDQPPLIVSLRGAFPSDEAISGQVTVTFQ